MEDLIQFFLQAGKLKTKKQRGWILRDIDEPVCIASHSFRESIMAWILGADEASDLDQEKLFKLVLLHDLVAGSAGDLTPYEPLLEEGEEPSQEVFEKWVRLPKEKKEEFFEKKAAREREELEQLRDYLPKKVAQEADMLWDQYQQGTTEEARFVRQVDMLEIFVQALQYWRKDNDFPIESWWQQMKELIHNPVLLDFLQELEEEFHGE